MSAQPLHLQRKVKLKRVMGYGVGAHSPLSYCATNFLR
jgi:hypothetical protein